MDSYYHQESLYSIEVDEHIYSDNLTRNVKHPPLKLPKEPEHMRWRRWFELMDR